MALRYDELHGAFDRSFVYRPARHRAGDLLSSLANPKLRVGDVEYALFDLSAKGASLISADESEKWGVGQELDLALILHGHDFHRNRARVARTDRMLRGTRVGLEFISGYMDLEATRRFDADAKLARWLDLGPEHVLAILPQEFRTAVSDIVYFFQYYRQCLEPHEAAARQAGDQAVRELAARTYDTITARFAELRERASDAAMQCFADPKMLRAAKQYTETTLTPLLLSAPMVQRSYTKPLGYPGDYRVMQYYYGDSFEGDSAFAKVVHKLFVRHPLSAGVCTRKDYVLDWMLQQHDRAIQTNGGDFNVTSLGCGPAREVAEFFSTRSAWPGRVVFRLFDQEKETLEVAYNGARRGLANSSGQASLECFNLSFGQLLKNTAPLHNGGRQHFVYATGLFDYLREPTAQALVGTLYDTLAPGGVLLIGNAIGPNRHLFEPEFILDWTLIYRTKEEMRRLAARLPGSAQIEVDEEPGGAYWFLRARKPEKT